MRWLVIAFPCVLAACGQPTTQQPILRMEYRAPYKATLFIVDQDGGIAYGGGLDAIDGKTSWSGTMTPEQQNTMQALIALGDWSNTSSQQEDGRYLLEVKHGEKYKVFEVPLTDQSATDLYAFLSTVALARLEPHLNTLPKPDMDVIIDRKVQGDRDE